MPASQTPKAIPLTTLKSGSRFFTTLTMRPGIYEGPFGFGGLTVKWEDTGEVVNNIHRGLLVIPAEWDNLGRELQATNQKHLRLVDAPGADYSVA